MKKRVKYLAFLFAAVLLRTVCAAQGPAWQESTQWTLYNVRGIKFYKISLDSLDNYPRRLINTDSMRAFLSHLSALPSNKPPIWMGAYVVSCIIEHKRRKIDISTYGGFFFDEAEGKFYEISQEVQNDWLNYLAECAGTIKSTK